MVTLETIKKNNDTFKFAKHFTSKNSIKNLLQGVQNAKVLATIIENEQYAKEILGYSNISEQLDVVLSEVFEKYTTQVDAWKDAGETRSCPQRVLLFRDLVYEGLENSPAFGATLGDFSKTVTGKEIEKTLKTNGIDNEEILLGVLTLTAVRSFINNIMDDDNNTSDGVERVVGEIVTDSAAHHSSTKTEGEEPTDDGTDDTTEEDNTGESTGTDTESTEHIDVTDIINVEQGESKVKENMTKLIEYVLSGDIVEIERILDVVCPYVLKNLNVLNSIVNEMTVGTTNDVVELLITTSIPTRHVTYLAGFNIDKLVKLVSAKVKVDTSKNADIYSAVFIFHSLIDILKDVELGNDPKESLMRFFRNINVDHAKVRLHPLIESNKRVLKVKGSYGYGNVSSGLWLNSIIKGVEDAVKEETPKAPEGVLRGGIFGAKGCGRPDYAKAFS